MAIIKSIKRGHAQALSNRVVVCIVVCLLIASMALVWATMSALWNAGHPLLALLAMIPLGTGLGYHNVATIRYCRPDWFKPEPVGELGRARAGMD